MNSKNARWLKTSGICGMITPIITYMFILLAINSYSRFDWANNALSDLGIVGGITSILFNSGLIIGGILSLFFATGLFKFLRDAIIGKIGGFLFILNAFALAAIGVFPENFGRIHFYVSIAFFVLSPMAMFFLCGAFIQMRKLKLGLLTFLAALIAVLVWIIHMAISFGKGVAIPEALSARPTSVWSIIVGFEMVRAFSRSSNLSIYPNNKGIGK
jgi:hypothetical membrane protein